MAYKINGPLLLCETDVDLLYERETYHCGIPLILRISVRLSALPPYGECKRDCMSSYHLLCTRLQCIR